MASMSEATASFRGWRLDCRNKQAQALLKQIQAYLSIHRKAYVDLIDDRVRFCCTRLSGSQRATTMARSVRERISSTSTILSWFPCSNGSCSSWPISPGLAHQARENLDRAHMDHDHLIITTFPLKLISRDLHHPLHHHFTRSSFSIMGSEGVYYLGSRRGSRRSSKIPGLQTRH